MRNRKTRYPDQIIGQRIFSTIVTVEKLFEKKGIPQLVQESFHISIKDRGLIEIAFIGRQTETTVEAVLQEVQPIIEDLRRRGQPVNILADNAQMTGSTIGANQRVMRAYRELPLHKAAGINANPVVRFVLNAIVRATKLGNRVKLFYNRESAEQWLLEP